MKMKTERDLIMDLMSAAIKDKKPNMVIRRLQDDKAFAIYTKVKIGPWVNSDYYYILIDVITQKLNTDHFNTINNLIRFHNDLDKGVKIPMSYYFKDMFLPIVTKDNKGNILEKLIKFNCQEYCTIGTTMGIVDNYITKDDVYNFISMLYKCAEFLRDNKNTINLNTTPSYFRNHFEFASASLDEYASKDEVLTKAITEDLYGYKIYDCRRKSDTGYYANIFTKSDKILIKKKCPICERLIVHPDGFTLYYTGLPLHHWKVNDDTNETSNIKDVFTKYLKGSHVYYYFKFNNPDNVKHSCNIFEKYLIPIVWFDFEKVNYRNIKLVNIRCKNCGKSLMECGD